MVNVVVVVVGVGGEDGGCEWVGVQQEEMLRVKDLVGDRHIVSLGRGHAGHPGGSRSG